MVDSEGEIVDWPRRWHQIVAEYNVSFERQQNEMRTYFEARFDQIRKENDDDVRSIRIQRDACAQRVCDIIDEQAEYSERISQLKEEKSRLKNEDFTLAKKLDSMAELLTNVSMKIRSSERLLKQRVEDQENEILKLDARKSCLREEIRDLEGFVSMTKRLSAEGGTVLMTTRRGNRRN
jgi:hypothetical protein